MNKLIKLESKRSSLSVSSWKNINKEMQDKLINSYSGRLATSIINFLTEHEDRGFFKDFYDSETKELWDNLKVKSGKRKLGVMLDNKFGNKIHESIEYEYVVNMDERGVYDADVLNPKTNKSIFNIHYDESEEDNPSTPWEDGFMKNEEDMDGLELYLQDLKAIKQTDTIKYVG